MRNVTGRPSAEEYVLRDDLPVPEFVPSTDPLTWPGVRAEAGEWRARWGPYVLERDPDSRDRELYRVRVMGPFVTVLADRARLPGSTGRYVALANVAPLDGRSLREFADALAEGRA